MKKNKIPQRSRMIIRDAVDLETDITDNVDTNKTSLTDSEQVTYSTIDLRHSHLKIFSLLTTSDKEINLRMYPDKHVQDMCKNHSWTTPYAKPLQSNHDIYVDCNARFFDSWYLNHQDLKPQFGYGELPQGVIDEFNKRHAFDLGTGSTIGMAETANADFKKKIIDGTYLTTSQGAQTDSLTCNICGKSYRDFACTHLRGSIYPIMSEDGKNVKEMRKCIPYTGALDAVEDSVVNYPANDTSTLMVFDTKKNRVVNMDNINEYSDIFNIVENKDGKVTDNKDNNTSTQTTTVIEDGKQAGLTPEQIKIIQKMIDEGKPVPASVINVTTTNDSQTTTVTEDDKNKGGQMSYVIKNAAVKRVFKDDMKRLGIKDMDKVTELFDKYDDTQIEFAMDFLGFIADNRVEETVTLTAPVTEPTTTPVVDGNTTEPTATQQPTTPVADENQQKADEQQTSVADSEEYKALKDQFDKAMKMLCDLKGIDNTVPNMDDFEKQIKDRDNKTSKINDFDF